MDDHPHLTEFQMMIKAPGFIFMPLILLAGVVALVVCVQASRRADPVTRWRPIWWALAPLALSVLGVIVGLIHTMRLGRPGPIPLTLWRYLAYTIELGALVSSIPLLWAIAIASRRPPATA
ncbi:unnamed protein product [Gemmataceae bacterium]|nr:unnamed protein product [Gemmataceae bacterium]VTU01216.1 unnamed protein product [Gemmataceae bacterium]